MMSPHSHEVKFNTSFQLSTEYWDRISRREIRRDFRDWQRSGREREREREKKRERRRRKSENINHSALNTLSSIRY